MSAWSLLTSPHGPAAYSAATLTTPACIHEPAAAGGASMRQPGMMMFIHCCGVWQRCLQIDGWLIMKVMVQISRETCLWQPRWLLTLNDPSAGAKAAQLPGLKPALSCCTYSIINTQTPRLLVLPRLQTETDVPEQNLTGRVDMPISSSV